MASTVDCRDRTNEFYAILKSEARQRELQSQSSPPALQSGPTQRHVARPSMSGADGISTSGSARLDGLSVQPLSISQIGPASAINFREQSEFTKAASGVSAGICKVTEQLEQLAKLVKQKSLFNDHTREINQMTMVIKQDIERLNREIEDLENYVKAQRKEKQVNKQASANSDHIVNSLRTQLSATAKSFSETMETRAKNLKEGHQRRKQFDSGSGKELKKSSLGFGADRFKGISDEMKTPLMEEEEKRGNERGGDQLQVVVDPVQEDALYTSRAVALREIETTIAEIGSMYNKLTNIIQTHEDLTQRIDADLEQVNLNLELANKELQETYVRTQGNKWLIIKIFAIVLLFILLFALLH